jgi:flagellin
MLGITQGTLSKSTEKLSSGYKINRAADDAAGLSISEKMRKQIRGLTQASSNAEDGISAVQTAEGALSEVQDMLQRMNELAVKSANGTNSESDRSYIQSEIDQLSTEIDRVAQTTKFNETYLLKGDDSLQRSYSFSYSAATDSAAASVTMDTAANGATVGVTFSNPDSKITNAKVNELLKSMRDQGLTVSTTLASDGTTEVANVQLNGDAASDFNVVTTGNIGDNTYNITDSEGNILAKIEATAGVKGTTATVLATKDGYIAQVSKEEIMTYYDADGNAVSANALGNYFAGAANGNNVTVSKRAESGTLYDAVGHKLDDGDVGDNIVGKADVISALNIKFQVGADTSVANKISVNIEAMSAKGLGINGLKVDGKNSNNADAAVSTIAEAIQKVSKQRSTLGAVQNRLEHTINNLDNVVENTTSAESSIRDTDMATEMVKYSNANILSQAGQAMLAQSNQSNQGVLSLLG